MLRIETMHHPSRHAGSRTRTGFSLALYVCGLVASVAASSCEESAPPPRQSDASDSSADARSDVATEAPLRFGTTATDLFQVRQVPHFAFTLPADRWEWLESHALDETYEASTLTFDGAPAGRVGLRFKGASGTLLGCVDAVGNLSCRKLSLKVKFSHYDEDRRFFGLKRLNLHAMSRDASQIRERLSYDLFQAMGVIGPRHSWATVSINGEDHGLYSMVEEVDGRFTDERWPDRGDGNLYKGIWPVTTRATDYDLALQTNEEVADPSKHDAFIEFASQLQAALPGQRRLAAEPFVDLDQVARHFAVLDAINGWDSALALLCREGETTCNNINYYWYQIEKRRYFALIPWDMDQTWATSSLLAFVPHWTVRPNNCNPLAVHGVDVAGALAPGCDPLIAAVAEDLTSYHAALDELLAGPLSATTQVTERAIDWYESLLTPYVAADPKGPGVAVFHAEVAQIRNNVDLLRQRLVKLRAGSEVFVAGLENYGATTFEDHDPLEMALGVYLEHNPESFIQYDVEEGHALTGERDLRITYVLRDSTTPYGFWAHAALRFREGPSDLRARTKLSFIASASEFRTLRVTLDCTGYDTMGATARHGWEVALSPEPTRFELSLATARTPSWLQSYNGPTLAAVRSDARGLVFQPFAVAPTADGFLPGGADPGTLQIDDIKFE